MERAVKGYRNILFGLLVLVAGILVEGGSPIAYASEYSVLALDRAPDRGGWQVMREVQGLPRAYFRDAYVGVKTEIWGATNGETWTVQAVLPPYGTVVTWDPIAYYDTLNGQSRCFTTPGWANPICGYSALTVLWYINAGCQSTGRWEFRFLASNAAAPPPKQFDVVPQLPQPPDVISVPVDSQGEYTTPYDSIPKTIKQAGCMLVDTVMILEYHGVAADAEGKPVTVENLNAWLVRNKGYDVVGGIRLSKIGRYSKGKVLLWDNVDHRDDATLRDSICVYGPTMIRVNSPSTGTANGHAVVATGRDYPSESTWLGACRRIRL